MTAVWIKALRKSCSNGRFETTHKFKQCLDLEFRIQFKSKPPNPLPLRPNPPCIQILLLGLSSMIKMGSFNPTTIPKPRILVGLMICYLGDLVNPQTNLICLITIRYFWIIGMGSLRRRLFMVLMMCLVECLARRALL